MRFREWFRPPRHLLLILLLLTVASVSALFWSGWKLTEQESAVEAQQHRQRLEQAADRIAALLRASLAETGDRLAAIAGAPAQVATKAEPGAAVLLVITEKSLTAYPPGRLLYAPVADPAAEAPAGAFAEGESAEILQKQFDRAAGIYARLGGSRDRSIQAGALMRLARVQRQVGQTTLAAATYTKLSRLEGVRVAGAPAELVARHALCDLSRDTAAAARLQKDLLAGRWALTRGQFDFYRTEAARLAGHDADPGEALVLTEAVATAWNDVQRATGARGQMTVWTGDIPWFVIWRVAGGRRAVQFERPESILQDLAVEPGTIPALLDEQGRTVAGRRPAGSFAVRMAAEHQLPWSLAVTNPERPPGRVLTARQRYMLLGLGAVVVFLLAGTYFVARAIRREIAVSQLQSDFVATVSHEFRSPLTVMRQLSEILALGRVTGDDRRQKYYDILVGETRRLQRLVETVLNFGKMEEGARQYRFEDLDAGEIVDAIVAEFEPDMASSGRRIELTPPPGACPIHADRETLTLALRNLVDNAFKYSPGEPAVFVEWGCENGGVAIHVRDRGMGIPAAEQRTIFQKFVRGRAAIAANVKGTGVGLAMVSHIVRAHGGKVRVVSAPGEGSTFTIVLPVKE